MKKNKFHKTFIYISIALLVGMMTVFATACASSGQGKSGDMELVYESDFSSDNGAFRYGEGEINEIQKGVLHLKKGTSDRTGWAGLDKIFGNNSTTTFRIKFGEPVEAHINFLQRNGDRLLLHFGENFLAVHSFLNHEGEFLGSLDVTLISGSWYDFSVSIIDYKVSISINDVELGTVAIDNRLPPEGNMSFECHEEYWIDDLRIVAGPSEMKEVTFSGDSVLYETDFSANDGMFVLHDPVDRPISEIKNGVLHFNGKTPGGNLSIPYGRDSVTTFRLKLSPKKPEANINLLWSHELGVGHHTFISDRHIHLSTRVGNEEVLNDSSDFTITPGEWHDISISIQGNDYKLRIDGRLAAEAVLDNRLPDKGYLFLMASESEFWVDDLRIVTGPSGMGEQRVSVSGDSVLYKTDFSRDDGGLVHGSPGKINEIREGMLHLKGVRDGQAAHAELGEVYGNNSITTFRIRFGEAYSKERAFADVNFLWMHPDDRVKTTFASDAFYIWTRADGQENFEMVPASFVTGRWYDVQVVIEDYEMSVTVDGRLLKTMNLDRKLPSLGHLNFECHDEYWVDDLRVVAGKTEGVITAKPEEKPVELEADRRDIQQKLDDSRIAVVGIKIEDDKEKTATALISFVIDAFVNTGLGMMMERQDVSKILEEYKFQQDGITDQSTAIEIGKLAGADVISIGSLYKVGSKHYLNIKLISVETGEILASSVATAETEDDYFDMCNEAVKNMLR